MESENNEIELNLTSVEVKAVPRRLRATWTVEMSDDVRRTMWFDYDVEKGIWFLIDGV